MGDLTLRATLHAMKVASPALVADPDTVCPTSGAMVFVIVTSYPGWVSRLRLLVTRQPSAKRNRSMYRSSGWPVSIACFMGSVFRDGHSGTEQTTRARYEPTSGSIVVDGLAPGGA